MINGLKIGIHIVFFSGRKALVEGSAVLGWLSPRQQYLDKGHCIIDAALLLLLSVLVLKSFIYSEWASNRGSSPSYVDWMMSLIMTGTFYHGCSEQTQTHKLAFLSLLWQFLLDMSYSSGYTETANTSLSSIFKSWPIYYSLKQRNNTTLDSSLKRAPVTSPAPSWKVEKF